jgi:hypothetical protein
MATTFSAIGKARAGNNGRHLGLALLVIATAQLMVVLDATIVIVAQPHIQAALGAIAAGILVVAITVIRVRRADLAGS